MTSGLVWTNCRKRSPDSCSSRSRRSRSETSRATPWMADRAPSRMLPTTLISSGIDVPLPPRKSIRAVWTIPARRRGPRSWRRPPAPTRRHELHEMAADRGLDVPAEQRAGLVAEERVAALGVGREDHVRRRGGERPVAVLRLGQSGEQGRVRDGDGSLVGEALEQVAFLGLELARGRGRDREVPMTSPPGARRGAAAIARRPIRSATSSSLPSCGIRSRRCSRSSRRARRARRRGH